LPAKVKPFSGYFGSVLLGQQAMMTAQETAITKSNRTLPK
jgi:hypothetical protein